MNVVDASLMVALFKTDERAHERVRGWYAGALREGLVVPSILLAEVAGALARSTGDAEAARAAVEEIRHARRIEIAAVSEDLAAAAADVARQQRLRGCDAVYVALARLRGIPLVTLDAEQIARGGTVAEVRLPDGASRK